MNYSKDGKKNKQTKKQRWFRCTKLVKTKRDNLLKKIVHFALT